MLKVIFHNTLSVLKNKYLSVFQTMVLKMMFKNRINETFFNKRKI